MSQELQPERPKLTKPLRVRKALEMSMNGMTHAQIAEELGVSKATIDVDLAGSKWAPIEQGQLIDMAMEVQRTANYLRSLAFMYETFLIDEKYQKLNPQTHRQLMDVVQELRNWLNLYGQYTRAIMPAPNLVQNNLIQNNVSTEVNMLRQLYEESQQDKALMAEIEKASENTNE